MLGDFSKLIGNTEDALKLAKDEKFRMFFKDTRVQQLLQDQEFKDAVSKKDMLKIMGNRNFREIVEDPEMRQILEDVMKNLKQ